MNKHVDLWDVQGNVARGYKLPHYAQLFGTIQGDVLRWKSFLSEFAKHVTSGKHPWRERGITFNVGVSFEGLAALIPAFAPRVAQSFTAYAQGMERRAASLGDPGGIDWAEWNRRHVWIALHAKDRDTLELNVDGVVEMAERSGLTLDHSSRRGAVIEREGRRLEHFGFRDGVANPVFRGAHEEREVAGNGKRGANGEWAPIETGEFLLGYPDERGRDVLRELPRGLHPILNNGTFAVLRILTQDVQAFRDYVEKARAAHPDGPDVAEKMVGRTRDGKALVAPDRGNDFDYTGDAAGSKCPLGAHARRANPRQDGEHRLLRRGIPFGDFVEPGKPVEGDRGIYFIALNANIENQFEFLQKNWLNGDFDPRAGKVLNSQDPLAASGGGRRKMAIEGDVEARRAPILLLDIPAFVGCRGGQYYFMPSLSGLRFLSRRDGTEWLGALGAGAVGELEGARP